MSHNCIECIDDVCPKHGREGRPDSENCFTTEPDEVSETAQLRGLVSMLEDRVAVLERKWGRLGIAVCSDVDIGDRP